LLARRTGQAQRYLLDREIARGGMGTALRAVDRDIRREVAVKYLLDQDGSDNKGRFVAEAQKKFDDALAQVKVAVEYDPGHAEARLLEAQVLIVKKDFPAARAALEKYCRLQPNDENAAELLRLCRRASSPR
jgi:hypothetical protein